MVMRVCTVTGCPTLYRPNGRDSRCEEHRRQASRERSQNRPELKYYSTAQHKRWRARILQRDPICVVCRQAPSTVADHYPHSVAELQARGLPLDGEGRGLCHPCHSKETARLQPGGWNAR